MNRTQNRTIAMLALGAMLLSLASPCLGEFKSTEAKLSFLKGKVEIQRMGSNTWIPAALKARVYLGDKLSSEAEAEAEITLSDGSIVKLKDKSLLVIERMERQKRPAATITSMRAMNGKVLGCIRKLASKDSKFSVTTPTAVAGVRGTVFGVFVDGDLTELDVLKGEVAIAGEKGGEVLVGEKMMTTVARGDAAKPPVAMTTAQIGFMMLWGGAAIKVGSLGTAATTAWYAGTPALIAASAVAVAAGTAAAIAIAGKKDEPAGGGSQTPTIPGPPTFPGQP